VKGRFVKLSADKWRTRWNSETAFYSYRWLAWALAGITLTLPSHTATSLPRDAGILLLLGIINVAVTAAAQSYVRLARRQPTLLLLDIFVGLMVVWMSGGGVLPFLPYALSALILPALLGGWGGAVIASTGFIGFDLLGMLLNSSGEAVNFPLLVVRVVLPAAFASCWIALGYFLMGNEQLGKQTDVQLAGTSSDPDSTGAIGNSTLHISAFTDTDRVGGTQQRTTTRLESIPRTDVARHAIFDPAPAESITFSTVIDQLATSFNRQSNVEMRVATVGVVRPLTNAQHSTLLRVAQESLLNVSQHAHAHTVLITLTFEPRAVTLSVQDDGVGLLDGTYERPGMHALRALRYRLSELDGQLGVFECESGGVTVRATLPME